MKFVDTSFWVALQFVRDAHHEAAERIWNGRSDGLITTNHVIGETWTFLRRRLGFAAATAFVDRVPTTAGLIVRHADEGIEREAWDWLRRHDEREFSFVDAVSFGFMRRHRLLEAMAFDGDFSAAGFIEVRPALP
ncbi:MAG: PIN domain-containing protein [Chloroflexota bacterium]|nr:MAG: PIN domain-containing protein [Chloroflexota bacterium]